MAESAMPTPERLRHAGNNFEIGGDARSGRVVRMRDTPIEVLLACQQLTPQQYEGLRRLRVHWFLGSLSGSVRTIDLDSVHQQSPLGESERMLMHQDAFVSAWRLLKSLERAVTWTVVLAEAGLNSAGAELGYRSPYRGRMAALELLRSGADRLVGAW